MYIFLKKSRLRAISSLIFLIFGLELGVDILLKRYSRLKPALLFLFWLVQCVSYVKHIPDPEKDIEQWVKNFEQQRSFSYRHTLETKAVYTETKGDCVIGRGEHIRGVWRSPDLELPFEYIGLGDMEYMKNNGEWRVASRGEESDIFTQIERLLTFDKFEYIGSDNGFLYRFKANIPFLAPDKRKEMVGIIKISQRNFLPVLIWAGLSDSSLYWKVDIFNYNRVKRIKPPFRQWNSYLLTVDTVASCGDCLKAIKRRLDGVGVEYRLKKTDRGIILFMTEGPSIEEIEMMLAKGVVNVYGLVENKEDALRIRYVEDDITFPVFLADKLFDHHSIKNAKIKFDAVSQPYIMIQLDKRLTLPSEIAVEIDDVIVGTASLDTSKKIDKINLYTVRRYYEMEILRASLAQTLPDIFINEIVEETQ